jgi:putative peptidoglycan lipid II flippase
MNESVAEPRSEPQGSSGGGSPGGGGASAGKAGLVSIAIMCSRILGLVREVILGGLFGGSKWMDGYMVAFRIPNMLRDLFAEGALSTAFVTTFSQTIKKEGDEAAFDLARKMLTMTAVAMAVITLICVLAAPWMVPAFASGWTSGPHARPELIGPTVFWSQIIYGFIPLLSLAALVMGVLNSKGVFFVPAMASSFFNLGSIVSGIAIGYWLEPEFFRPAVQGAIAPSGVKALTGMSIGVVIGGMCQLGFQLPALRHVGFRFRPDFRWSDPGVKRVLALMGPAIVSGAAVQAGVVINTVFASFLQTEGAVSSLQWAFRLMQLPIGVFGVAIATVTLPAASRAAADGINDEFRAIIARGLRLAMLVTVPSAIGLAILAEPIIATIWQRGRFNLHDTMAVAGALRGYALGLIFYSAIKILQPTFYSINHKWVPMWVSLAAIALNALLNSIWIFGLHLGHEFLALSTTIGSLFNFLVLYAMMLRYAKRLETGRLLRGLAKIGVASTALTLIALGGQMTVLADWRTQGFLLNAGGLALTISIAMAAYFGIAKVLQVEELSQFTSMVMRRVKR